MAFFLGVNTSTRLMPEVSPASTLFFYIFRKSGREISYLTLCTEICRCPQEPLTMIISEEKMSWSFRLAAHTTSHCQDSCSLAGKIKPAVRHVSIMYWFVSLGWLAPFLLSFQVQIVSSRKRKQGITAHYVFAISEHQCFILHDIPPMSTFAADNVPTITPKYHSLRVSQGGSCCCSAGQLHTPDMRSLLIIQRRWVPRFRIPEKIPSQTE